MNANKYKLPVLRKVRIENYDLYKCPFDIELSKGLNIIYGTNGLGKTTLLNMIQYSIIGPYTGGVKTRTFKGQQKKNRPKLPDAYFKNRLHDQTMASTIISFFTVGSDSFVIKHSLVSLKLLAVEVNSIPLTGDLTSYDNFEKQYFKTSEDLDSPKLSSFLITKYQKKLIEASCFPDFSSLITMMTDGMFFTEDRTFTFWENDLSNLIISKYFMDQNSYKEYGSLSQNIKYLDSQARLKTYELSFIKKFLDGSAEPNPSNESEEDDISKIEDLRSSISSVQDELVILEREILDNRQSYEEIHSLIMNLDSEWYKMIFPDTYKESYTKYHKSLEMNICPICGQKKVFDNRIDECFVCGNHIEVQNNVSIDEIEQKKRELSSNIRIIDNNYQELLIQIQSRKKGIRFFEKEALDLAERSKIFGKTSLSNSTAENQKIYEIELEKTSLINQLDDSKEKRKVIIKHIDEEIALVFNDYAHIFNKYTNSFFGANNKSDISLISSEGEKFFRFKLNGITR
jgi:energy-coupling factor transporter ATP-binding protein EcfA2